jgi:hypothetical protein
MSRHYSSTPFFKWVRKQFNIHKPNALGWGEWDDWDSETRIAHPIGWFFCETLPDLLEKPGEWFVDPIMAAKYYCINRFIDKRHVLKTGLKPGQWNEFETRLLHGMFNEFIDFVEVESAWNSMMWADDETRKLYNLPWYYTNYWFRWRTWRSPQAGLQHYRWASTLRWIASDENDIIGKKTPQAESADEIIELYHWWKFQRPARGDSWVASGFRQFWDSMDEKYGDGWLLGNDAKMNDAEKAEYRRLSDRNNNMEQEWDDEDTAMMCRLVKIRRSLWT